MPITPQEIDFVFQKYLQVTLALTLRPTKYTTPPPPPPPSPLTHELPTHIFNLVRTQTTIKVKSKATGF